MHRKVLALVALLAAAASLPPYSASARIVDSSDSQPGSQAAPPAASPALQPILAQIPANPALWTVHGLKGTAYLFGSFHALPSNVDWHTKRIDAAMAEADAFVFEMAMDESVKTKLLAAVKEKGLLPEGQHLHDLLSPAAARELDAQLAALHLSAAAIGRMRPWLANITIETAMLEKENYKPASGIEMQLEGADRKDDRPIIALETPEQQLALIVPTDPKAEIQAFESALTDAHKENSADEIGPLLDAWIRGDVDKLDLLMNRELALYPDARKLLIDDRNAHFADKIAELLEQPKTYFVTVGAAHLGGPHGVANLLRQKGFRVDGP